MGVQIPPSALIPNHPAGRTPGGVFCSALMKQSLASQRQLRTVRQIVIALGVLGCLLFAVLYSSRIITGVQAQKQLAVMKQRVAEQEQFQSHVQDLLDGVDDPAAVEAYARNEGNLARPGDQVMAPLTPAPTPPPAVSRPTPVPATTTPNWKLWWQLLAAPAAKS